jgi:glucose-1-phosphate adenylyltransferase
MKDVLTLILGGGRGTQLYPLTRHRSEPAVPFGGKYRLIDIPVSNCLHSGLNKVFVLTQYLSVSLHRHMAHTYNLDPFDDGFIEVLAAQQTNENADWYRGTADAMRQNRMYLEAYGVRDILILYADQIYRMDFRRLIRQHRRQQADLTMAALPVDESRTHRLGVLQVGDEDRVLGFVEKPGSGQLGPLQTPRDVYTRHEIEPQGRQYLANMGIYLVRRDTLMELFDAYPKGTDLVRDLLLPSLSHYRVHAQLFDGYWEDVGTIRTYYDAHMALLEENPAFDFHAEGGVFTRMRNMPAARILHARMDSSLIADGAVIGRGTTLERSVVGIRSLVGPGVQLRNAILIGADEYESESDKVDNERKGIPNLGVGEGSVIHNAILDKDCRIGKGVRIVNERGVENKETETYVIRDGIVVVPNEGVIPDGTVI